MKIATWNVNSIKVRLPQVLNWLEAEKPDVLGMQETKVENDTFPKALIEAAGFQVAISGQKTYNGVAVISRKPMTDIVTDLPGIDDPQRRVLGVSIGELRLLNLYVPNGQAVESDKYDYKMQWLAQCRNYLHNELGQHEHLVVMGDFNIAPENMDVYDSDSLTGQVLFSERERQAFAELIDLGLTDTFRMFEQKPDTFSWWDYRMGMFRRNRGLRIDHMLASRAMKNRCTSCHIDREPRTWERPSDHVPVVAEFSD